MVPLSMALASHLFVGRSRAAALGVEGAATYVGMAIGRKTIQFLYAYTAEYGGAPLAIPVEWSGIKKPTTS